MILDVFILGGDSFQGNYRDGRGGGGLRVLDPEPLVSVRRIVVQLVDVLNIADSSEYAAQEDPDSLCEAARCCLIQATPLPMRLPHIAVWE